MRWLFLPWAIDPSASYLNYYAFYLMKRVQSPFQGPTKRASGSQTKLLLQKRPWERLMRSS